MKFLEVLINILSAAVNDIYQAILTKIIFQSKGTIKADTVTIDRKHAELFFLGGHKASFV
ncbi:hypothetical protein [Desulfobacula phenolica]|uniref:Uncharacterized protein n=1 Tax=Desulfobacula phenolica TaxID=90732 RepID=A0A1H2FR10_9BACT|nr:hypothetical protein [Desulfobacula phenolica]SDU09756.1 hypothetical protein SAMN04487931_104292 [Desulfobacula phenolica]